MGYALFAQNKVALTGRVNSISLMQTQRSNEQNALATEQLSLQQQLSSIQASQSQDLAEFYELLSHIKESKETVNGVTTTTGTFDADYLNSFKAHDEAVTDKNGKQTVESVTDRNKDQYSADAKKLIQAALDADGKYIPEITRENINATIKQKQSEFDAELADINNDIYQVSVKENVVEMEVKRLDTALTSAQKQLDAVIDAEGDAIEKATPKFSGNG